MAFLARYWRVLAIAAAVAAILILVTQCTEQAERRGYERAQSEGRAAIAKLNADTAAREAQEREISRAHDIQYQEQTRALRSQIDSLTARNVDLGRLQGCAGRRQPTPAGPSTATAESDGGTGKRIDDLQAEQTFGIELVRYAGECEQYRQRLNALQSWVTYTLSPH